MHTHTLTRLTPYAHPRASWQALEKALLSFHTSKMADINKIVKELWQKTYRNSDIDYIQVGWGEARGTREQTVWSALCCALS